MDKIRPILFINFITLVSPRGSTTLIPCFGFADYLLRSFDGREAFIVTSDSAVYLVLYGYLAEQDELFYLNMLS